MNTHFAFPSPDPYAATAAQAALENLGVRHIRDDGPDGYLAGFLETFAQYGIKFDVIWQIQSFPGPPVSAWNPTPDGFAATVGLSNFDSYEGTNEPNAQCSDNSNWVVPTQTQQAALWSYMQAQGLGPIPLLSPALCWGGGAWSQLVNDATALGSMAPYSTYGNLHSYPTIPDGVPSIPEQDCTFVSICPAYPGNGYNLASNIENSGQPVIVTETGYSSQGSLPGVGTAGQERYTLRLYLENWMLGVVRTYVYQLLDDGTTLGLVDSAYTPKPAYEALQNLIALLNDPGATFTPGKLNYQLGGALTNVDHVLLEKRNGTFEEVLWQAVASIDANASPLTVSPQNVTLTFATPPTAINAQTFTSTGSLASVPVTGSGSVRSIPVTDIPVIVSIQP